MSNKLDSSQIWLVLIFVLIVLVTSYEDIPIGTVTKYAEIPSPQAEYLISIEEFKNINFHRNYTYFFNQIKVPEKRVLIFKVTDPIYKISWQGHNQFTLTSQAKKVVCNASDFRNINDCKLTVLHPDSPNTGYRRVGVDH
jgi:hypothetical protein